MVSCRQARPDKAGKELFVTENSVPICARDGFPKVRIDGRWHCVAEYLDRCIGGQRIVDMVEREGTVYYVFESGHELPSLCFCCGRPYEYSDLEATRRENVGRHLVSMIMEPGETEDGQLISRFCLELSGKGLLSKQLVEPIHIEAAAQMRHPANCSRGRTAAARRSPKPKKRRSKRRRR
jgi:hypothetical protein